MVINIKSAEENYEDIKRIMAALVKQLNQTIGRPLLITASLEWVKQLHEEYVRIAPELDIHNCSRFLILKINEYILEEARRQLKDSYKQELIHNELLTTKQQIRTLLTDAGLNRGNC